MRRPQVLGKPYEPRCNKCKWKNACRYKFTCTDGWTFCDTIEGDAFEPI